MKRKSKLIIFIAAICLIMGVGVACNSSEDITLKNEHVYNDGICTHCGIKADKWDGDVAYAFQSGTGAKEDPYIVKTAEQLAYLAQCSRNINFSEKYIVLENNIDLAGKEWEPIHSFAGNFDGNGHSIFSWKITKCDGNTGFFSSISGQVSNLRLEEFIINYEMSEGCGCSSTYDAGAIGGLVGNLNCGWIDSCAIVNGKISATRNQGELNVGGIAGQVYTASMDSAGIMNSYSDVTVSANQKGGGNYVNVGGIAGSFDSMSYAWYAPTVQYCYSLSRVSAKCSSFWNCAGCYQYYGANVGGIVGFMDGGSVKLSYVYGKCEITESSKNIGNIVGWKYNGSIEDCYVAEGHVLDNEGTKLSISQGQDAKLIRQSSLGGIVAIVETKWDTEKWYFIGSESPIQKCFVNDD